MSKTLAEPKMKLNMNGHYAQSIQQSLEGLNEKVVFAESCTGGDLSSTMATLPGISKHLCGSLVTYRPEQKQKWLKVDCRTIDKHSTESKQVAREMVIGALRKTPEASWAVSVVGHLGPDAPSKKDGMVYFCIGRRTAKGKIKIKELATHKLSRKDRETRQKETTEVVLTNFARYLLKWQQRDKKEQNGSRKVKA